MQTRNILLAALVSLLFTSCTGEKQDASTLDTVLKTKDPRVVAQTPVTCTAVTEVCGRLYEERGGACLSLTESAAPADRAAMRTCALNDFRQALTHLPSSSDRLVATRGLAESLQISRDNTPDATTRTTNANELPAIASQLQGISGGAPYGAYYLSNNDLNRVLTRSVPAGDACATLKSAQVRLPGADAPADLSARLTTLRKNLADTMRVRSCV